MVAIFEILIYVAFAFFASYLAKKSENYIEENNIPPSQWDKYLTYFVLFFTIIAGIRWNVGMDSITYAHMFAYPREDNHELVWCWMVKIINGFNLHWTFGLALCGFIQIFFITKALQRYRWLLVFLPLVFFGGRYWMDCMNAVRQMMVACGFLWASKFIYEKKLLYYSAFVFIGSLVHHSALLLLPFFFIPSSFNIKEKRFILIGILLACVVIGQTPAFADLGKYVQMIAGATSYENYADRMSNMLTDGYRGEALSFGPMMLSYILIPIFIIVYGKEIEETYGNTIPLFNIWFNFAYFYACGYFLVCNISHLYIRPMMYFSIFQMVLAALLLRHLWLEYSKDGSRQIATLAFCCIIVVNTAWDVYKATSLPFETSTYKIFIFNKEQRSWFNL